MSDNCIYSRFCFDNSSNVMNGQIEPGVKGVIGGMVMRDEMLSERDTEQVLSEYIDDDFPDVKKEKDINLVVTPQAKEAFSRKPYYMYTSSNVKKATKK